MLIVAAEKAFGRRPAFQPNPPNALPYTCLAVGPGGQLVFRPDAGPGSPRAAAEPDALGLAAEAAAEESPRSAAMQGAVVTQQEAAAALGGAGQDDGGSSSSSGRAG